MKYYNGSSVKYVCSLECNEAVEILNKYNVSEENKERITGMIKEAYYQLEESFKFGRAAEKLLAEKGVTFKDMFDAGFRLK